MRYAAAGGGSGSTRCSRALLLIITTTTATACGGAGGEEPHKRRPPKVRLQAIHGEGCLHAAPHGGLFKGLKGRQENGPRRAVVAVCGSSTCSTGSTGSGPPPHCASSSKLLSLGVLLEEVASPRGAMVKRSASAPPV